MFGLRYDGISARKGGKRRENCFNGGSFCFARTRKKSRCSCLPPPILFIFAANIEVFIFFAKSIIMRFFQVLAFSSLCMLALFGAVSCDDVSTEPTATPSFVVMPAAGGEATAKVLRMDGGKLRTKWAYKSVEVEKGIFYRRDSTLRIDTLTDGRVKYSSSWYAFYVNMAKNEIHAVVSPNKSKNQRSVRFLGDDLYGAGLVSFAVHQEADSTAAN